MHTVLLQEFLCFLAKNSDQYNCIKFNNSFTYTKHNTFMKLQKNLTRNVNTITHCSKLCSTTVPTNSPTSVTFNYNYHRYCKLKIEMVLFCGDKRSCLALPTPPCAISDDLQGTQYKATVMGKAKSRLDFNCDLT